MKKEKDKCSIWDRDKDRECGLIAKYECTQCGIKVCKKHEEAEGGECPDCPPPIFRKIK